MRLARLAALLLLLLPLTACQDAFDIQVAPDANRADNLAFVIAAREAPKARPRYHSVQLIDLESKALLWHLRAEPFGTEASQSRLRYGAAPKGFVAKVEARPLEPGREYVLIVGGKARGQLRFGVDDAGRVRSLD